MGCNSAGHNKADNRSILVCANDDMHTFEKEDTTWAATPVECLSAATENRYDMIILYIAESTLIKAGPMIELCALLKKNRHTRNFPVTAVCCSVNRRIVEQLAAAGIVFVVFRKDSEKIDGDEGPGTFINQLTEENRPERVLARLCPHIYYNPIAEDKELTTCRAYANWLVLGPRMLKELCEIPRHMNCPYYKNPRLPK